MKKVLIVITVILVLVLCTSIGVSAVNIKMENDSITKLKQGLTANKLSSIAEVNKYKEDVAKANKLLKEKSFNDIPATVTFKRALTRREIAQMEQFGGIKYNTLEVRLKKGDERITAFTRTDGGLEYTEAVIKKAAIQEGMEFVGFISGQATVRSDQINCLETNDKVYLIDASCDGFFEEMNRNEDGQQRNSNVKKRYPKSLAWEIEDMQTGN